jgi:hypothetical protein
MALVLAFALGYAMALQLWAERIPSLIMPGFSVIVLPMTWMVVALRVLGPRVPRGRLFYPPGIAACLAVSAASLLSLFYGWDHPSISSPGSPGIMSIALLRAVQPLPLASAVAGGWLVLALDRRWRPERNWLDRLARCLGFYWLGTGLIMPLLHLFFV